MTPAQLEAIFKANLDTGHLEALEAIYTQGYCAGAGITVTAQTPSAVPKAAAPTTIVKITKPDLR
jgi:hypothetical protein